ncbi:MAG: hypothetical protein IKW17_04280, partial [Paludibacteraceae bacterium]|nr:hypothetical protein [Paludibacteraceae bacterium]
CLSIRNTDLNSTKAKHFINIPYTIKPNFPFIYYSVHSQRYNSVGTYTTFPTTHSLINNYS